MPYLTAAEAELSDTDLEAVAGGKGEVSRCSGGLGFDAELAIEGGVAGAFAGAGPLGAVVGAAPGGVVAGVSALVSWLK